MYATAVGGDGGAIVRQANLGGLVGGGRRGDIVGFSAAARRRLRDRLLLLPWGDYVDRDPHRATANLVLVTLTYPRDFPTEFETYKSHLASFHKRLARARGEPIHAMWRLEFQKRGAPHYHILVLFESPVSVARLGQWCRRSWYEVVGSGDTKHRQHGADVRAVYKPTSGSGGLVRYLVKYLAKLDHHIHRCGRCWGEWGEMPQKARVAVVFEIREGFVEFLRRVRRWGRKSRYLRAVHHVTGLRLYGDGTSILTQLARDLPGTCVYLGLGASRDER